MGKILYFPRSTSRAPARKTLHHIRLRIIDERDPSYTRWKAQYYVQNARGFPALKGFTDRNARRQRWHGFDVKPSNLPRFTRGMQSMVDRGLVELRIDGKALLKRLRRRA